VGNVGLLYVGAVLFVNGIMLLGWADAKSVAPMNLFVGALQVVTPTYLIFTANGDTNKILGASGLYLFGFTYLYVAFTLLANLDSTGGGFFYGFVAVCALVFSGLNFWRPGFGDSGFGVIWLSWAFLWALFFVLLALKKDSIGRYTGAVAAIEGIVTAAIPAFLLLTGNWAQHAKSYAIALAIFGVVVFGVLYPQLRQVALVSPKQSAPGGVAVESI
jgi:putative amide transporter protein